MDFQNFQNLPDLVLLKVFGFFSHEEKVRTLMLVCKRFHVFLREEVEELCIYENRVPYKPSWGFFSQGEIADQFIVKAKDLDDPATLRFGNLRKLFLYKVDNLARFLNATNECNLSQLVELKISKKERVSKWGIISKESRPKNKIHLPSLKRLWVRSFYGHLALNMPNLESLDLLDHDSVKCFELCAPGKLKFLKCRHFTEDQFNGYFVNLEHLICCSTNSRLSLEKMPRLKRIELWPGYVSGFSRIPQSEAIKDLQKQKKTFNRRDLEIWHCGFKENYHKISANLFADFQGMFKLNSFGGRNDRALQVFDYFDYEEPISMFPEQIEVCSSIFVRKFPNFEGIPNNFFKVFTNIKAVHVDCKVDGPSLIQFLKNAKGVRSFSVNRFSMARFSSARGTSFDLKFFKELSQIQSICSLILMNAFPLDINPVDVSFLLNFKNLKHLTVSDYDHELGCRLLKMSIKKFKKFIRTVQSSLCSFELASGNSLLHFSVYPIQVSHNIFVNPDEYLLDSQDDLRDVFFSDVEETAS